MTERIAKAGEKPAVPEEVPKVRSKYARKPKIAFQTREKKAVRQTTVLKSAETVQRLRERETKGKRKHYRFICVPIFYLSKVFQTAVCSI